MLGRDVVSIATARGHGVRAYARAELDIVDAEAVHATVLETAPDAVINCAAWTNVDGAESEAEAALAVNGTGAGHVAAASVGVGAWLVHVSTDYVFDGSKRRPYVESDPVDPHSQYGIGKLAGERAVAQAAPDSHTTVRSSWLFGTGGPCFPKAILKAARERDELTVVDDQVGCPTFTGHLAGALLELAEKRVPGVVHVAGGGHCSWNEFAKEIVASAGLSTPVLPGSTADLGRPAPRPAYSVIVSERCSEGVPVLPHWHEGLAEFIESGVPT